MFELRDYQTKAIQEITEAIQEGHKRILLVAPTGSGKTAIASEIMRHACENKRRVIFLAHRRELVFQCSNKLKEMEIPHGILMSTEPYDPKQLVQVISVPTLYARCVTRQAIKPPEADLLIQDEAHHTMSSETWQEIHKLYSDAYLLGMTATPINKRGKGSGKFFDVMIKCPSILELIKQKHLVKPKYYVPKSQDIRDALRGAKIVGGDYVENDLDARINKPKLVGDVVENWARLRQKHGDRKTLVFGCSVKHSMSLAAKFNELPGIKAEHIDGNTPKDYRDMIVDRFKKGYIDVLCNCIVFTEGFDCPEASMLVFARPTKSLLLYIQVAGRILRSFPGKEDAIIVDHAGVIEEHDEVDQDWPWLLEYHEGETVKDRIIQARPHNRRNVICSKCNYVFSGLIECPECGERIKVGNNQVDTWDAYLIEKETEEEIGISLTKDQTWAQLKGYAIDQGWDKMPEKLSRDGKTPKWCYANFQELYNCWPHHSYKNIAPQEPTIELVAYLDRKKRQWINEQKKKGDWKWKSPFSEKLKPPVYIQPQLNA